MPMKKISLLLCTFFLFLVPLFIAVPQASSDTLDDVNKQLSELNEELSKSVAATKPVESELKKMQDQISGIKNRVAFIDQDIERKRKEIDDGYKDFAKKEKLISKTIREFYVKSYYDSPLLTFFSEANAAAITQNLAYQRAKTNQNKAFITNIALSLVDLETKKENLKNEQAQLVKIKASLDEQSAKLDKVVAGAKDYQKKISTQIAQLSAQQQNLIAAKLASLGLPTSAYTTKGGCSSDLTNGKDPGFSPRFGLFSFGVPHRVGMSQYGAKGRADGGSSYQDILSFYFPNTQLTTGSTSTSIHVTGTNEYGQSFDDTWSIEEYVKHIYEIPTTWNANALRAQAVAARSYAMAVTNNGASTICPSQSCQVVKKELNSDAWVQAVNDTAGQVLTSGGQPIQTWFSSTAGGYTHGSGEVWGGGNKPWTRTSLDASGSVGSFSDLLNNAYDRASPWFYCDWGSRSQYSGTAWLKSDELADIVNVILLAKADSSTQNHLAQPDKPNPDGVETWDASRVRQELGNRGITAYTSISSGSVDADFGSGTSTSVHFSGSAGSATFSGSDFKSFFNLRAPANINIVGPLYNIEKQ
jgi:peptidoglycan hydrolase-like amidase